MIGCKSVPPHNRPGLGLLLMPAGGGVPYRNTYSWFPTLRDSQS